jgi:hypothetical protein
MILIYGTRRIDGDVQTIATETSEFQVIYRIGSVAFVGRETAYLIVPVSEIERCN